MAWGLLLPVMSDFARLEPLKEPPMQSSTKSITGTPGSLTLNHRRGAYYNITEPLPIEPQKLSEDDHQFFEEVDLIYRTLCSIMYNFVPNSGHPGGSISSGRIVESLLFRAMEYDFSDPGRADADIVSYAAGHKAMGMYAMWALRNELVRLGSGEPGLSGLMAPEKLQLRLEDLLGFRRNPTNEVPLFKQYHAKALDGHATCATPFVRISTGASGVGVPASLGLALGAIDMYPEHPPKVHMLEGEGGMTPGRVHEALAAASSIRLHNAVLHVDWNQASIDSNCVCREDDVPGDYVQWNPMELCYLHDWNVIYVPDGFNFSQISAAQELAASLETKQPTAIVYRTVTSALLMTPRLVSDRVLLECANAGITLVWIYGISGERDISPNARLIGNEHGIRIVPGYCPLMFLQGGAFFHKVHAVVWKFMGRYPA